MLRIHLHISPSHSCIYINITVLCLHSTLIECNLILGILASQMVIFLVIHLPFQRHFELCHYVLSSILSLLVENRSIDLFSQSCFRSFAAVSASFQVLNPSCTLSFKTVLLHIPLGHSLLRLPLGAHVNATLGFIFGDILRTCPSHFYPLDLTNSSIVLVFDLCLISSLPDLFITDLHRPINFEDFS